VADRHLRHPTRSFVFLDHSPLQAIPRLAEVLILGYICLLSLTSATPGWAISQLWTETDATTPALPALQQLNKSLIALTQRVLPAVVSLRLHTKEKQTVLPQSHPPIPENTPPFSMGSGFIIRADGFVLTNYHVIEHSTRIDVQLHNGERTTATIVGQDPVGDLALLQITTDHALPVVPLGSSANLQVGEFVVAAGSPFGFEHSITFGIISAKNRHFLRSGLFGGFVQTDAAINTGNSGGPLINMRGEVVGMNTATVGRGDLGFAIPIDAIKAVLPQLYSAHKVTRGWLGVQIRPLERAQAQTLGLDPPQGVYVHDVLHDQPAQQSGILVGDIILSFDGQTVATPSELQSLVASTPVGKKVAVQLLRKQARQTVELTVGTMPLRQ
jgi:serine protease Do